MAFIRRAKMTRALLVLQRFHATHSHWEVTANVLRLVSTLGGDFLGLKRGSPRLLSFSAQSSSVVSSSERPPAPKGQARFKNIALKVQTKIFHKVFQNAVRFHAHRQRRIEKESAGRDQTSLCVSFCLNVTVTKWSTLNTSRLNWDK